MYIVLLFYIDLTYLMAITVIIYSFSLIFDHSYSFTDTFASLFQVVLGIESETKLRNLSDKLKEAVVDHKLWIEQPEDLPTCLVTKPYPKEEVSRLFKKLKLLKLDSSSSSNEVASN